MTPDEVVIEFRDRVWAVREHLHGLQRLCRDHGYPLLVARHHVDQLMHHLDDADTAVREMQQAARSRGYVAEIEPTLGARCAQIESK